MENLKWGPYSKRYAGVSHITDEKKGMRFDLSLCPGYYRSKMLIPNVTWESGYHPWESAPDLSYYSMRYDLEWKDKVYADISFSKINGTDDARLIRCHMVNNGDMPETLVLHYMASMNFPSLRSHSTVPHAIVDVDAPDEVIQLHALDYADMAYAIPRPTDNLMPDGLYRGEIRGNGFVSGSALSFGDTAGDKVSYKFTVTEDMPEAVIQLRCFLGGGAGFTVSGDFTGVLDMPTGGGPVFADFNLGRLQAKEYTITFTSTGQGLVTMDSVLIGQPETVAKARYLERGANKFPTRYEGASDNSLVLKYPDADQYYGLYWDFDDFWLREIHNSELDSFMRLNVHHHTNHIMMGDGQGHFTNVFMRPIALEPKSHVTIYGVVVTSDSLEHTQSLLAAYEKKRNRFEETYELARKGRAKLAAKTTEGEAFRFSQERMAATVLNNIVFPVYKQRSYISHYTPGRWWDCLYTWDSGFLGIGLSVLDEAIAVCCLETYLTPEGDTHCAFIHHGSVVPVQFYQFMEIWNKSRKREMLARLYPSLRQYYLFFTGQLGSSTTKLPSNLLKTWDYFYNSGGWDDYAPQVYAHLNGLTPNHVAPSISTSHAIRCARILVMVAKHLGGLEEDIARYQGDEERFAQALQQYSWDEEAGYFSYVCHDDDGMPTGILRHEGGQNYNMGLDGVAPIISGTLTQAQEQRLLAHIKDPGGLWTSIGLTAVDQRAAYYKKEGYWNGTVWMPHQWFIFKALLDLGQGDMAYKIAETALNLWKNEVEATYNCYEHFIVATGRGAGWHQFGGLSSPVLYWYQCYYLQGHLTAGYDVWINDVRFSDDYSAVKGELCLHGAERHKTTVVACMKPGQSYAATFNGEPVDIYERLDGVVEVSLPNVHKHGILDIQPV